MRCAKTLSVLILSTAPMAGLAADAADELVIGVNPKRQQEQRVQEAFQAACRVLAKANASIPSSDATQAATESKERQAAVAELQRDRRRSTELALAHLNPATVSDAELRIGALRALQALKPSEKTVSLQIASSALNDPAPQVRSAAVSTVRARRDDVAIQSMIGAFLTAFATDGAIRDKALAARAQAAFGELNDKRVYQALIHYVFMELRLSNISAGSLDTRQIDSYSVQNGGNATFPVQLALPIQMPSLQTTSIKTSVVAPAISALTLLTGQNFGEDVEKWARWAEKQK